MELLPPAGAGFCVPKDREGHGGTSVPRVEGIGLVELSQMFGAGAAPDVTRSWGRTLLTTPQPGT